MQKAVKYLKFISYWAIILIPFSIAIAPGVVNTFIGFLFFSFLAGKILNRERLFVSTPINLPFLLFMVVSLVSFINSVDYGASFRGMEKLVINALLFLICAEEIRDRKHMNRIILSVIFGASLASFDAIWQVNFGKDFIRGNLPIINIGLTRATAAFPDANVFGVYLSAITPLIIGLTLFYFKGREKIAMILAAALATTGIILTFSRGTALGLYVGVLFISICKRSKIVSLSLVILLLVFPFILPRTIKDWAKVGHYNPVVFMCNTDRISVYKNSVNMVKHHPIIGVGVNTYSKNYLKYKLPEPDDARTGDFMYAHNHFLQMAGEVGLTGLGIFLWLLFRLFKRNMHIFRSLKDEYYKILSLSIAACLIAFLVNGLTETSLYYSRVSMIFWYFTGFTLALGRFTDGKKA